MGRDRRSIKEIRKGQWKRWAVRETGVWDTGQGAAAQLGSGTVSRLRVPCRLTRAPFLRLSARGDALILHSPGGGGGYPEPRLLFPWSVSSVTWKGL